MTARVAVVDAHTLTVPLHTPFVTALRRATTVETLVVRVADDEGRVGWGEAPQVWQVTGDSVAGARACVEGPLADALLGLPADPLESSDAVQHAVVGNRSAKAAVDVALHDLAARRADVPLARHLGATSLEVPTDVTLAAGPAHELAAAAAARVAEGFDALKLKVGTSGDDGAQADVARVRAVRDAVGSDVALRLDANQGWDAFTAVTVVHAIEDAGLDVELVEQPVPAHDVIGLAHVTAHVDTPVMADESLFTLIDLVELLRAHAADLVNVKLAKCGGLTPALELVDVARRHGVGIGVGSMMESHLGVAAAAALAAAVVPEVRSDLDAAWWAAASPYDGGPSYAGGTLVLSDRAGLGIALNHGP